MNEQQVKLLLALIAVVVLGGFVFGRMTAINPQLTIGAAVGVLLLAILLFRGLDVSGLNPFESIFYVLFLLSLIVVWSPFKFAAYLAPIVFHGLLILAMAKVSNVTVIARFTILTSLWAVATVVYIALYPDFVAQNSIISFFTLSSFFPLLTIPTSWLRGETLYLRVVKALTVMVVVQSIIGMMQFIYGMVRLGGLARAVGDHVEGTIDLHPAPYAGAATSIYIVNMGLCLIALGILLADGHRRARIPIILGTLSFVLTDRVHVIAIMGAALAVGFVLCRPQLGRRGQGVPLVAIACTVVIVILTSIISYQRVGDTSMKLEKTFAGKNEKYELFRTVLFTLPDHYPLVQVVGLGPGQFCSRASAISAGYLGTIPPPFKFTSSTPFTMHGLWLWKQHYGSRYRGSVERPSSSWFSIISEFGFPFFFLICGSVAYVILRILRTMRTVTDRRKAFAIISGILFLFGIGAADFYWEICQSVFVGALTLKLLYANYMRTSAESVTAVTG